MKPELAVAMREASTDPTTAESGPRTVRARFAFSADSAVFRGHFPDYPLVPAVYLIEAVRDLVADSLGAPLAIETVQRARFTQEVRPADVVELETRFEVDETQIRCRGIWTKDDRPAADVRLQLRREESSS
jgi:3-hydroxyacyl-[acyl-carrier-protein] dehydratase